MKVMTAYGKFNKIDMEYTRVMTVRDRHKLIKQLIEEEKIINDAV